MRRISTAALVGGLLFSGMGVSIAQTIGEAIPLHAAEQRANTTKAGAQQVRGSAGHTVAPLPISSRFPGGGFAVVWTAKTGDTANPNTWNVFARRFHADGTAYDAADISINAAIAADEPEPTITAFGTDGGFVVSWLSRLPSPNEWDVLIRPFGGNGQPLLPVDLPATIVHTSPQWSPVLTTLADGKIVVVWESFNQDGSFSGIYFRRFSATGATLDTVDRLVNVATADQQVTPSVAPLSTGGFVIAWASGRPDGSGFGIFARRFNPNGAALDPTDIPVNATTVGQSGTPTVAALPNGGFVVTWAYFPDGFVDLEDIVLRLRRFDGDGIPLDAADRPVETLSAGIQSGPAVSATPSGRTTVAFFSSAGSTFDIYARRFAAGGAAIEAAEFRINTTLPGFQGPPSITTLPDGETAVVVWMGNGPGDTKGVFFQRLRVAGAPVARNDVATTAAGTPVLIDVLANDADADPDDVLRVTAATVNVGTVTIVRRKKLRYTPPPGGATSARINYTIKDSTGKRVTARVVVTITP